LTELCERSDNLVGNVRTEVNREGELCIGDPNEISELLATFELLVSYTFSRHWQLTLFSLSHFSNNAFFPC
jgi:hypothetical protein